MQSVKVQTVSWFQHFTQLISICQCRKYRYTCIH